MRIALDIDGVLNYFQEHLLEYYDLDRTPPTHWDDPRFVEYVPKSYLIEDFWLTIPRRFDPKILNFEPVAYVTARGIPTETTMRWLWRNEFPEAPVITVGHGQSKVDPLKKLRVDLFLDDSIKNYREINNAGIRCVLFNQSHNEGFRVMNRVYSIQEFINIWVKEEICT